MYSDNICRNNCCGTGKKMAKKNPSDIVYCINMIKAFQHPYNLSSVLGGPCHVVPWAIKPIAIGLENFGTKTGAKKIMPINWILTRI